ncbi:YegP family protein [Mycolicibacterium bacteremicum]|uniref:DUF1508 domain-containing protein n=1 Tax=Mycolicibacterium bacteremicum TaxID=564198 RepID=A0A1W9YQE1_MYCBA|nr:YegP family protein [Mycolicibacterium bacteremicum]ORA02142.1 hypothetical protein BST17_24850 [Mycolicibacterium bacteremicum]
MRRPGLYVRQSENGDGEFWYVIKSPNGHILATSEMFPSRSNAKRAARAFIRLVAPVTVEFSYWAGPVPPLRAKGYRLVTERIR